KTSLKDRMLKIIYNSPLEKNLNLILRYDPIVKMLKKIAKKNKNLKVLEIGSGSIGITRFYKGHVVGIDVESEKYNHPRLKFMKGSATTLPSKSPDYRLLL
ncbi:hypothetical protein CMO83_05400, partial [Candidatus Woesearchaeota archaeon]|nr:hypothetical protein [Candidatus Woesearchaeota archaeon]